MSAFDLMQAFDAAAIKSRADHNLPRKAVFDHAVQIVAMRSVGVPLGDLTTRVWRTLLRESTNADNTPEVQGYYREALDLMELFED